MNYVLDGKEPVAEPDIHKWAKWRRLVDTRVARDEINGVTVSTVFLGIDHNFMDDGPPLLFETMTFPGADCYRYSTWHEAEAGHRRVVDGLKAKAIP